MMKPNTQIVIISNTSANLVRENKVWSDKVFLFEEDTGKFKRGDDIRPYRDLRYVLNHTVSDNVSTMLSCINMPGGVVQLDDKGSVSRDVLPVSCVLVDDVVALQGGDAAIADTLYESYMK